MSTLNPLPDLGDIVFLLVLQFLLFTVPSFVFGDGSTGWHLISGNYILDNHKISHCDLISYTFPGHAWVAYEWLSDFIMAGALRLGGLNGVAVLCSSIIALVYLLLYERCRKAGLNFPMAMFLTITGALASSLHWLARPHIFTFLAVYVFSTALEAFHQGKLDKKSLLVVLTLSMALWVNLHPAFLLGIVLTGIYLVSAIVQSLLSPDFIKYNEMMFKARWLGLALVFQLVASLLNPYGFNLFIYLLHYLQGSSVIAATNEFQSPVFHLSLQSICLEIIIAAFLISIAWTKKQASLPHLMSCLVFLHLALSAVRNIPLFVIVVLPLIANLLSDIRLTPLDRIPKWANTLCSIIIKRIESFHTTETSCQMHLLPLTATILLFAVSFNHGELFGYQLLNCGFSRNKQPTSTLSCIREYNLPANHGFNYDNWGGLLAFKLGIPVFIDDRADFYGQRFYLDYSRISQVETGWQRTLDDYKINWILFPINTRLANTLLLDQKWHLLCQDQAAMLFIKHE